MHARWTGDTPGEYSHFASSVPRIRSRSPEIRQDQELSEDDGMTESLLCLFSYFIKSWKSVNLQSYPKHRRSMRVLALIAL